MRDLDIARPLHFHDARNVQGDMELRMDAWVCVPCGSEG